MTGTEVKDAAPAHLPDAAAAEVFALVPAFLQDDRVGLGHVERFIIHLGLIHVPFQRQPGGDGMSREQRGDVARRAVAAVGGEDAARQGEFPNAVLLTQ